MCTLTNTRSRTHTHRYVSGDWAAVGAPAAAAALRHLAAAGYTVMSTPAAATAAAGAAAGGDESSGQLPPQLADAAEWELALRAEKFAGATASSHPAQTSHHPPSAPARQLLQDLLASDHYSALAITLRRAAGRWAADLSASGRESLHPPPLSLPLPPLFPLPWVFTYNAAAAGAPRRLLMKTAVASAVARGGVMCHCLLAGDPGLTSPEAR